MSIEKVKEFLKQFNRECDVIELSQSSATVALAAQALGVEPARIAKTLSFKTETAAILVVTAGEGRLLSRDAGAAAEEWTDGLTAGDETAGGNLVFYVKNTENGAISTAVTETYQIDKTVTTV